MRLYHCFQLFFVVLCSLSCLSQTQIQYKQVDTTKLFIEAYYPDKIESSKEYSAMLFFFGGGWKSGNKNQFLNHAKYFSKKGVVCFLVDYRIENLHNTSPIESLKDAKSAIRFVRKNAAVFGIDPAKIIASGGSAGGHLAAASALIESHNDDADDLSISCVPNALVLFNPVIDNGPGGIGYKRIGGNYKSFSPLHNIKKGAPPTIIFLGTDDKLIPVSTVKYFKHLMNKVGSKCELKLYEGQSHGFFNYNNTKYYKTTVEETKQFLSSLNYL